MLPNKSTDYGIGVGIRIPHLDHILERKPVVVENVSSYAGLHASEMLGIPLPGLTAPFVAGLTLAGGALLALGLASRLIALPLTINMAIAYITADREAKFSVFSDPDKFYNGTPYTSQAPTRWIGREKRIGVTKARNVEPSLVASNLIPFLILHF